VSRHRFVFMLGLLLLLGIHVPAQQPQATDPNLMVYTVEGSNTFHRKYCDLIADKKAAPVAFKDLPAGAEPCFYCKPLLNPDRSTPQTPAPPPPTLGAICYLIDASAAFHADASTSSPTLATLAPLDVVQVVKAEPGWLQIETLENPPRRGWIRATKENLIPDDWFSTRLRLAAAKRAGWPAAVQADVARKNVRIGFTLEQVTAALGDPLRHTSEETAEGITDVLVFRGQVITLKGGSVAKIERVEK